MLSHGVISTSMLERCCGCVMLLCADDVETEIAWVRVVTRSIGSVFIDRAITRCAIVRPENDRVVVTHADTRVLGHRRPERDLHRAFVSRITEDPAWRSRIERAQDDVVIENGGVCCRTGWCER